MKTGLVLEGGSMRGMFTSGILDCWMDHGLSVDAILGVSAGAVFGCNLKSRQRGRAIRYNMKYCTDWRYASFRSLLLTGDIFGVEFCYHVLPYRLDVMDWDTFVSNPVPLYVACTDVTTGQPVYHLCGDDMDEEIEWLRASASMPLVSKIVRIGGMMLLDGGIADSIPLKAMQDLGFRHNIVILTQPEGFVKQPNRLVPAARVLLRRYPKLIEAMADRHIRYNSELAYVKAQESTGDTLVLRPPHALDVSQIEHDPQKLKAAWQLGYDLGVETLEQVRAFMNASPAQ